MELKANSSLAGCLLEHTTGLWKVVAKDDINTFSILVASHIIIRLIVSVSFQKKQGQFESSEYLRISGISIEI